MNTGLTGKIVIVTGASGAIGSSIARRFAEEGAKVVLHYHRNRQSVEALRSELKSVETLVFRADLAKETETRRLFEQALRQFGRIDTLVANAGSWETTDVPLHKMSLRQWRHTLDNVLTNTFLCMREFLATVARQKRGNALLIASTAGVFGEPGHADYAAAKSAMAFGLTRSLKNEIARLAPPARNYCGGRVNCICPGWTVAPRNAAKLQDSAVLKRITATMALRKVGQPDDMAHAAVFLSSDKLAGHITGQTLIIAGGMEGRLLWL
jgi:3-oxoacyl-[acyl-carrier protein] reductase